jgi:type IV secretory pathway VirD2 relaxase
LKKSNRNEDITLRFKAGRLRRESPQGMAKAAKAIGRVLAKSRKTGANLNHSGTTGSMSGGPATFRASLQRVAVRFSYAKSTTAGLWKAHGKYLERESAQQRTAEPREPGQRKGSGPALGFGSGGEQVVISETLDHWQDAGDSHVFRVIVSPEFGDEIDLKRLTKETMARMEADLGTPNNPRRLEWAAVEHINTDNPHTHIVIRGVDAEGHALNIPRDYIKEGARERVQEAATRQIGYRTEQDHIESLNRQVSQQRFTEIDRALVFARNDKGLVTVIPNAAVEHHLRDAMVRRLLQLKDMGLAEQRATYQWQLSPSLEQSLRSTQVASDLMKTKALHRARITDPGLPLVQDKLRDVGEHVAGRVVGTGLDDNTNRPYMLIEGVDGRVHYVDQTQKMQSLRGTGDLGAGDFVSLDVVTVEGRTVVQVENYGRKITATQADNELIRAGQVNSGPGGRTVAAQFRAVTAERLDRLQKSGAIDVTAAGRVSLRSAAALDRVEYADLGMPAQNYTDTGIAGRIEAKGRETIAVNDGSGIVKVLTTAQLKEANFDLPYARQGAYLVISESSPGRLKATQIRADELDRMVTDATLNALDKLHTNPLSDTNPLQSALVRRSAVWNERGLNPRAENFRIQANTWNRAMETKQAISAKGVDAALADLSKQIGKPIMDLGLAPGARVTGRAVCVHKDNLTGSSTVLIDNGRELCKIKVTQDIAISEGQRVRAEAIYRGNDNSRVVAWRIADLERLAAKGKAKGRTF